MRFCMVLLLVCWLSGCETLGYYRQGIAGQWHFYGAREPITQVLAKPDIDPVVRRRLELVPQITAFAETELQLPVRGQYRDYVQLESTNLLWSVFAAPELSLDAHRWCYLLGAICVEYRAYFAEGDARKYAGKLAAQGFDTYVGSVSAFSSLGLLDDPVTSVLVAYPDELLAMVLFHELAHAVLYVKDDTTFNESFASAVADEGLARWLAARGELDKSAVIRQFEAQEALLTSVALDVRRQLEAAYVSPLDDAARRARKREILAAAPAVYLAKCATIPALQGGDVRRNCPHASWFAEGLNNAQLNAVATYKQQVPAFAALLRAQDGDLAAFYRTVRALAKLPRVERDTLLHAMLPATGQEAEFHEETLP